MIETVKQDVAFALKQLRRHPGIGFIVVTTLALGIGATTMRGTIAMARTGEINSATSQFFINVKDNGSLDYKGPNQYGYAVFGHVIEGLDVVDEIRYVQTIRKNGMNDVPSTPVVIYKAYRKDVKKDAKKDKKEG